MEINRNDERNMRPRPANGPALHSKPREYTTSLCEPVSQAAVGGVFSRLGTKWQVVWPHMSMSTSVNGHENTYIASHAMYAMVHKMKLG
jgi:hypothetical protein